jgi:hypothetical protein
MEYYGGREPPLAQTIRANVQEYLALELAASYDTSVIDNFPTVFLIPKLLIGR